MSAAAFTEQAATLRGNAASALVRSEVDFQALQSLFSSFAISSTSANELADNEGSILASCGQQCAAIIKEFSSALLVLSSAVSSSTFPTSASAVTAIVDKLISAQNALRR